MEPLATVLGCSTPITENAAFEALQHLLAVSDTHGEYARLELHVLRIGKDLVQRSGLANAPIGVSVTGYHDASVLDSARPEDVVITDGTMRAASSLPGSPWLGKVGPATPRSASSSEESP